MKYWIGEKSLIFDLSKKYFEDTYFSNKEEFIFHDLYKSTDLILSEEECFSLNKLLYISEKEPMGRVDKNCKVGKVEINPDAIKLFSSHVKNCLNMISNGSTVLNLILNSILKKIVPISETTYYKTRENGSGMSCHWLKGSIFLSTPKNIEVLHEELCLNIIHELGHQSLMLYQEIDPLINDGLKHQIYSSVRKTDRPAILSFHAHIAVFYMIYLLSELLSSSDNLLNKTYLISRLEKLKLDFLLGAEALSKVKWTSLGIKLFSETIDHYEVLRNAKYR